MQKQLRFIIWGVGGACSLLCGWLIAVSPGYLVPLLVPSLALAAVAALALRLLISPGMSSAREIAADVESVPEARSEGESTSLADGDEEARPLPAHVTLARALFYCGLATLSFLVFRPVAGLTVSDLFFLLSLGIFVLGEVVTGRSISIGVPRAIVFSVAVYALGAIISSAGAVSPLGSLLVLVKFGFIGLVWFSLGTQLLNTYSRTLTAAALWTLSVATNGGVALAQSFGVSVPHGVVDWGRYGGLTDHITDMGAMTSIALVPAVAMAMLAPSRLARLIVWLPAVGLIAAGLVVSESVTGMGVVVPALGIFLVLAGARLLLWAAALAALALVANMWLGFLTYAATLLVARVSETTDRNYEYSSLWGRIATYQDALHRIMADPLVGVGLDWESKLVAYNMAVHNVFLGAWYEAGILGFIGMVSLFAAAAAIALRNVRLSRTPSELTLAAGLASGVVAYLLFAQSGNFLFQRYGWVPVMLMLSLHVWLARAPVRDISVCSESQAPALPSSIRSSHQLSPQTSWPSRFGPRSIPMAQEHPAR